MKKITIVFKKSKRTGKWYWRMKGNNNEKMGHSPPMKSLQWAKELAGDFIQRGYFVEWFKNGKPLSLAFKVNPKKLENWIKRNSKKSNI